MRSRNIKPAFFENEDLSECSFAARLLYIGLWCYADREGKFEWRPKRIKAIIYPYDNIKIDQFLNELVDHNFIKKYKIDDTEYGLIPKFLDHQKPHPHEASSKIPDLSFIDNNDQNENPELNQCHDMSLQGVPMSDQNLKCSADIINDDIINDDIINDDITPPGHNSKKEHKIKIMDFVFLTEDEYMKLVKKLGHEKTEEMIYRLNSYIGSKGKKYKSHYYTILNWINKDPLISQQQTAIMTKAGQQTLSTAQRFLQKHREEKNGKL